jgi:hypothetical protein
VDHAGAADFLLHDAGKDSVPARAQASAAEPRQRIELYCQGSLDVAGAAPDDMLLDELTAIGRHRPQSRVAGIDVIGVAIEDEGRQAALLADDAAEDIANAVQPDFIKGKAAHLGGDEGADCLLLARHARRLDEPLGEANTVAEQGVQLASRENHRRHHASGCQRLPGAAVLFQARRITLFHMVHAEDIHIVAQVGQLHLDRDGVRPQVAHVLLVAHFFRIVGEEPDRLQDVRRKAFVTEGFQGQWGVFKHVMKDGGHHLRLAIHLQHDVKRMENVRPAVAVRLAVMGVQC